MDVFWKETMGVGRGGRVVEGEAGMIVGRED